MTVHINYNHRCAECGAVYIPYGEEVRCPKCGLFEQGRFSDFVRQAAGSALYNFRTEGNYMPMAWACSSLADSLLMFLFQMFDGYVAHGNGKSFDKFAREFVRRSHFADTEYLRGYTGDLGCRVYEYMQSHKDDESLLTLHDEPDPEDEWDLDVPF